MEGKELVYTYVYFSTLIFSTSIKVSFSKAYLYEPEVVANFQQHLTDTCLNELFFSIKSYQIL